VGPGIGLEEVVKRKIPGPYPGLATPIIQPCFTSDISSYRFTTLAIFALTQSE
jgi:hypothetical protein